MYSKENTVVQCLMFLIKVYIHISLCLELPSRNKWFLHIHACVCAHACVSVCVCTCLVWMCYFCLYLHKTKKLYLHQLNACYIHKCVYRELIFIHNFHRSFTVPLEFIQGIFYLKINMITAAPEYQDLKNNDSHF